MGLDDIDRRILSALQRDCSEPLDTLADRVGLSRNATWRRIKRLEVEGFIRARVALLDPERLGIGLTVLIAIRTRQHEKAWADSFVRAVRQFPEITSAWRTSGDTDYMLLARVADVRAYDRLYQRLIAAVPLEDVTASFVMEDIKATTELPL